MTEEEASHLYLVLFGEMGLCGCGAPSDALETIEWILSLCPLYESNKDGQVEEKLTSGGAHIVLSLMTKAGLIEHGGCITGSWITKKGKWVRKQIGNDPKTTDFVLESVGFPHNGEACDEKCSIAKSWEE